MNHRRSVALGAGLCLVFAGAIAALAAQKEKGKMMKHEGKEEAVTAEQVPQPARDVLTKLAGGATIDKYEKEAREGATVYEADWMADGREFGAMVTADGVLVAQEETVTADNVPTGVKEAAARLLAGATNLKYEKKTFIMYKVEGTEGGKEKAVMLMPTGHEHGKNGKHCEKKTEKAAK